MRQSQQRRPDARCSVALVSTAQATVATGSAEYLRLARPGDGGRGERRATAGHHLSYSAMIATTTLATAATAATTAAMAAAVAHLRPPEASACT
jgi:hypothetical protein